MGPLLSSRSPARAAAARREVPEPAEQPGDTRDDRSGSWRKLLCATCLRARITQTSALWSWERGECNGYSDFADTSGACAQSGGAEDEPPRRQERQEKKRG